MFFDSLWFHSFLFCQVNHYYCCTASCFRFKSSGVFFLLSHVKRFESLHLIASETEELLKTAFVGSSDTISQSGGPRISETEVWEISYLKFGQTFDFNEYSISLFRFVHLFLLRFWASEMPWRGGVVFLLFSFSSFIGRTNLYWHCHWRGEHSNRC